MLIDLTISGVSQTIDTIAILYAYDNSGLKLVLSKTIPINSPYAEIFENNADTAVSTPSYATFVSAVSDFLQVAHLTLTTVCINLKRIARIEVISSSDTLVRFDNGQTVEVNVGIATLLTAINAALVPAHNSLSGLQGGTAGQYYHMTAAGATVLSNTSGINTGDNTTTLALGADVATTSTTFVDVSTTGNALKFPVKAGSTYWFRFVIIYSSSSVGRGSAWSINGPTLTNTVYRTEWQGGTSRNIVDGLTTYDATVANASAISNSANIAIMEGIITCSANGDVVARMLSSSSGNTITAKTFSTVQYKKIS